MVDIVKNELEGSVTFPANTISHTGYLNGINDDKIAEPDEQFALTFSVDSGNAFNDIYFESELDTESLSSTATRSFTIKDNDSITDKPVVYLHGQAPIQHFPVTMNRFPSTRIEIAEGGGTKLTATLKGAAPEKDLIIPLKWAGFPTGEVDSSDFDLPEDITIRNGENSGTVELRIKKDSADERHYELLAIEIDEEEMNSKYEIGDRNRFEVIMVDSDEDQGRPAESECYRFN